MKYKVEKTPIIKNNILMARFLDYNYFIFQPGEYAPGWRKEIDSMLGWISIKTVKLAGKYLCRNTADMEYHKSYDWLFTVVEKIETIDGFKLIINGPDVMLSNSERCFTPTGTFDIQNRRLRDIYDVCAQYINFYNPELCNETI